MPFFKPIIIGGIDIEVESYSGSSEIEGVRFYIDNELKCVDYTPPYSMMWKKITPLKFKHTIKIVAFTSTGNEASVETTVWRFL